MLVSLFTSRVVLQTLGIVDYGVYNAVGGIVAFFSLITTSLSNSISRFLSVSLASGNNEELNDVFCTSVIIQFVMALIIGVILEVLGVWFLNEQMNIPLSRLQAANWVLHFSILTFCISLVSVPYNALIIAHEKMSAFAYISIIEVVFKLLVILILFYINYDKLILWSFSLACISILVRFIYSKYSNDHFPESKFHFFFKRDLFMTIGSFAGWSFIGEAAGVLKNEGVNILLNIYFGPVVNAANGIAQQINNLIFQFVNNFLTAVNPQIIKKYASNDLAASFYLVMNSTRYAFYVIFIIVVPILFCTYNILAIWLVDVPEHAVYFVQLIVILAVIETICLPLITLQRATGVMRNYQIVVGTIHLLNFPVSWFLLSLGLAPEIVYIVAIFLGFINLFARLFMLRRIVPISVRQFLIEVILNIFFVSFVSLLILFGLLLIFNLPLVIRLVFTIFVPLIVVFLFGLKHEEKQFVISTLKNKI